MTAQRVKPVVIALEVEELVVDLVLENRVLIVIPPVHQVNIVVITLQAQALAVHLVLENRV